MNQYDYQAKVRSTETCLPCTLAQLTTLPTGEVVLVMGPSADSELSALKEALA